MWKTDFKKFEIKSSTNFISSTLEYFAPNHLAKMNRNTDLYMAKYDQLIFLEDFNEEVEDKSIINFCFFHNLPNMINKSIYCKDLDKPCYIDLILTNYLRSFQNSCSVDFHKLVVESQRFIAYCNYKSFSSDSFRKVLQQIVSNEDSSDVNFTNFISTWNRILD